MTEPAGARSELDARSHRWVAWLFVPAVAFALILAVLGWGLDSTTSDLPSTLIGFANLALYIDQTGKAAAKPRAFGLPATALIDPEGREIGRLIGPAEWDTPEMMDFLRGVVSTRSGASSADRMRHSATRKTGP